MRLLHAADALARLSDERTMLAESFIPLDDHRIDQTLSFQAGGKTVSNPSRPPLNDLDALPRPAYHLFPFYSYKPTRPTFDPPLPDTGPGRTFTSPPDPGFRTPQARPLVSRTSPLMALCAEASPGTRNNAERMNVRRTREQREAPIVSPLLDVSREQSRSNERTLAPRDRRGQREMTRDF